MSIEENKAIIRRFWEEMYKGNPNAADEFFAEGYVAHVTDPRRTPDRDGLKRMAAGIMSAFPDYHATVDDLLADGDKVIVRSTSRGTHKGELKSRLGTTIAPTGRQVAWTGIVIYRLASGKIVEAWGEYDDLGLLQQLGVIPNPS